MSNQTTLQRLKAGVRRYQDEIHAENAARYRHMASTPQQPHTLMVACADSRVDVETITGSQPGEIFVSRNVGNMVPAYGDMLGGVSAAIEYAVVALQVSHVVVCGHSDCGAMKALLSPGSTDSMPTVKNWLHSGHAALTVAMSRSHPDDAPGDRLRRLTEGKRSHAAGAFEDSPQRGRGHGAGPVDHLGLGVRDRHR